MAIKTNGFKMPNGDVHTFIPPSPTENERGGVKAKPKTTESLEVAFDETTERLYAATPDTDKTLSESDIAADAKVTGDKIETKLDKNQGKENVGKALVIGGDGNVVPGEVQSGDDLLIVNTASGESPLAISDSSGRRIKGFRMTGKTEQVQTTGANLFDEKLLLDFDSENYDKTQSAGGLYYYKFPINGTVTVSTKNVNKNGEYLTVGLKPDGSDRTWLSHKSEQLFEYKTLTPENGNIYLGVNNILERVKSMLQNTGGIIINEGSTAKPYEPYTGGKPAPSPEYPQEIKSIGKWNEATQKYEVDVKVSNCGYLQKGSYANEIRPLPLEKGKTYRIYVGVNSAVMNVGILNEERTFVSSGDLYSYYNSRGYPINSTGVVSGICRFPNLLYNGYTFTVTVDGLFLYQGVNAANLDTDNAYVAYDFIKKVDMSSPYTEKESVVLTSNRPITKWDKLVEQDGEIGWLYQHATTVMNGGEIYSKFGDFAENGPCFVYRPPNANLGVQTSLIDGYTNQKSSWNAEYKNAFCIYADHASSESKYFRPPNETILTIEQWKEWLSKNNLTMIYKTKTTEFIPLPQEEQDAIRAMTTYYPSTTLINDQGCTMELDYVADPKNFILGQIGNLQKSLVNTQIQLL